MFDETLIVKSAISAFNNSALYAPAFLWWAILALPIFIMAWFCGGAFLEHVGWKRNVLTERMSAFVVILTWAWVIMFGGNYAVLRDSETVLPWLISAISFLCAMYVVSNMRDTLKNMWRDSKRRRQIMVVAGLVLVAIGLSDLHTWWGPILSVGATIAGCVCGRVARAPMRAVPGALLVISATTIAILMQPEFFRFGQLGALTIAHILGVALVGTMAVATLVLRNVNPQGRVHHSAYVKLKWMARCLAVLGLAMFALTESVPVFLGFVAVMGAMFAMSVWHETKKTENLWMQTFAITMICFGIITGAIAISVAGVIYMANMPRVNGWRDGRFLL